MQVHHDEGVANRIDPIMRRCPRGHRRSVTGDCVKKARKRCAVREMKEDPSEPLCRTRLQTAMSCFGRSTSLASGIIPTLNHDLCSKKSGY